MSRYMILNERPDTADSHNWVCVCRGGGGGWGGGWGRKGSYHGITKYNSPFHGLQNAILRFHDSRKFKNYKCRNDIKFEEKTR